MTVKIYKLIDPFTTEIRYVGKTKRSLVKRLWEHINQSKYCTNKRAHKESWIKQVLKKGGKPKIELINEVEESQWEQEEINQISLHAKDFKLTNKTKGGLGGNDGCNKRKVAKLDYLTLEVLNIYDSIHEAGDAEGMNYTRIIDACSGRKFLIRGFLWRYVGDNGELIHPKKIRASHKHKIGKYDFQLRLLHVYTDTESTNEDPAAIWNVCKGKTRSAKGYIWRFLDVYNNVIEPTITYKYKTVSKMDLDGNIIEIYQHANAAAASHEKMNPDSILQCCREEGRIYRGFRWKFNTY